MTLTLWGDAAHGVGADLESRAASHPVLAVSHCRVSAYNGVSVSALQRSVVSVDPAEEAAPGADALRRWWAAEGAAGADAFGAAGEGLAGARAAGGAGAGAARQTLSLADVRASAPPTAEGKPAFSSAAATVASINPDQTLYYPANPANNRKVVETGDGQWYCEFSSTTLPTMVRRYILQVKRKGARIIGRPMHTMSHCLETL